MAQTTGGLSGRNCYIASSPDGAVWTDISGFTNRISPGGGDRQTDEVFTMDGDTPIIKAGKRKSISLKVAAVYTEGGSDPFEIVRAAYEGATDFYLRWAPKGNTAGNFLFTSSAGIVTSAPYPEVVDIEGGKALLVNFEVAVATVTKSVAV